MYKVECRKLIASPFFLLSVIALYFVILLGIRDFYPENEICDSAFEIDRGMLFPFEITKSQNVVE